MILNGVPFNYKNFHKEKRDEIFMTLTGNPVNIKNDNSFLNVLVNVATFAT